MKGDSGRPGAPGGRGDGGYEGRPGREGSPGAPGGVGNDAKVKQLGRGEGGKERRRRSGAVLPLSGAQRLPGRRRGAEQIPLHGPPPHQRYTLRSTNRLMLGGGGVEHVFAHAYIIYVTK